MGRVTDVWLSCYLVLPSVDSKNQVTRQLHIRDPTHIQIILATRYKIALNGMPQNLINEKSTSIEVMAWCHQAISHYLSQRRPDLSHRSNQQRINSLEPNDTIWWRKTGSTLAQVMACCLTAVTAPSHYLNQCGLIISKAVTFMGGQFQKRYLSHQWPKVAGKIIYLKISLKSSRDQWVNTVVLCSFPCYSYPSCVPSGILWEN